MSARTCGVPRRAMSWLVAGVALLLAAPARAQLVSDAGQVCPSTADPCIVSRVVEIANGALLDFGLRSLEVRGGMLDSGTGAATVRCGSFKATAIDAAISAHGPSGQNTVDGGSFTLEVVRGCSADLAHRCTTDEDCRLGACQAGHCALDVARSCGGDEDCDVGLCSIGSGDVDIDGPIVADGRNAGSISIEAAGDILIRKTIDVDGLVAASDGGAVDLFSGHTSVTVAAPIEARGGGNAQGGLVFISAADSVSVLGSIDATGGDFDGGFIGIEAGEDATIESDLLVDGLNGAGSGGDISIVATNDLTIAAGHLLSANGSEARQGPGSGDGGTIELSAGHDLFVLADTALSADGAIPDGSGDTIELTADGALSMEGTASARARGDDGEGGDIALLAGGALDATSVVTLDVRGGSGGGGSTTVSGDESIVFAGAILADAKNGGTGDIVSFESTGDVRISGDVSMGGTTSEQGTDGAIEVTGCSITLASGASLVNTGVRGVNTLTAGGEITVQPAAQLSAHAPVGKNRFVIGSESPAPVVNGTVNPAPQIVRQPDLVACAECGNGRVEQGETCDDHNLNPGDGCTDCQDDRCIAQTLNWPLAPLCNDEMVCTADRCDPEAGACDHVFDCDDGFACTEDSCGAGGECLHEPNSGRCEDGNVCTKDVCLETSGCIAFDEDKPCDDGLACTGGDACVDGRCRGTSNCAEGSFCSNATGECVAGSTTTTTTNTTLSTTTTTVTTTTLAPVCGDGDISDGEECDDGSAAWVVGEPCNANCQLLDCGDPDDNHLVRSSDSLVALRTAVGIYDCAPCICDVNNSGGVAASDALTLLRLAIGLPTTLMCPPCSS